MSHHQIPIIACLFVLSTTVWAQEPEWSESPTGPFGGHVIDLLIFDGTAFALTKSGLYKSRNVTEGWQKTGYTIRGINQGIIGHGGNLYIGTSGWGLWKSTNAGASWASTGRADMIINAIAAYDNAIYALSNGEVLKSTNEGANWQKTTWEPGGLKELVFDGSDVFRVTNGRLVHSPDKGMSWVTLISSGVNSVVFHEGKLIVGARAVLISSDRGKSWTTADITNASVAMDFILVDGRRIYAINEFQAIFRSTDGGAQWQVLRNEERFVERNSVAAIHSGRILLGTRSGLLTSSGDNVLLERAETGINAHDFSSIHTVPGHVFAACSYAGLFHSSDDGFTWTRMRGLDPFISPLYSVQAVVKTGQELYAVSNPYLHRSTDFGSSWSRVQVPESGSVHFNAQDQILISRSSLSHRVAISNDAGRSWRSVPNTESYKFPLSLLDTNVLLLGSYGNSLLRSHDYGSTWTAVGDTSVMRSTCIAKVGGTYYAGGTNGLWKSTDRGISWGEVPGAPKGKYMVIYQQEGSLAAYLHTLYLYPDAGVYFQFGDSTWRKLAGAAPEDLSTIKVVVSDSTLFAASSSGIFILRRHGGLLAAGPGRMPGLFVLSSSGDEVHLNFAEGVESVDITLVNIDGRSLLQEHYQKPGLVRMQTGHLTPGAYIMSAESKGRVYSVKFIKE